MKIFDYDGVLMQVSLKIVSLLGLSLLWLVSSIPIVTIGASSTALYFTVTKVLRRGEGYIWEEYWSAFRTNFKQATVIWLIQAVFGFLIALSCYYTYHLYQAEIISKTNVIIILVLVLLLIMWALYFLPYIARFSDSMKVVFRNCTLMFLGNIGPSVINLLCFSVALAAIVVFPAGILLAPTGYALLSSFSLEKIFRKYIPNEEIPYHATEGKNMESIVIDEDPT